MEQDKKITDEQNSKDQIANLDDTIEFLKKFASKKKDPEPPVEPEIAVPDV